VDSIDFISNNSLKNMEEKYGLKILTEDELKKQEEEQKRKEIEDLKKEVFISKIERAGLSLEIAKKILACKSDKVINIFQNSIVMGSFGVGKTWGVLFHVLNYIKNASLKELGKFTFIYRRFNEVFDLKYKDFEAYEKLKNTKLLIIDEFLTLGTYSRADIDVIIHDLVDSRILKNIPTILITNLKKENITQMLEGSIISRLKEFEKIVFSGHDRRGGNDHA
jgi:DNA replication protein DnaC